MKNINPTIQQKIINLITALLPKTKIYLYGSRARGDHSGWSDIDIALDTGNALSNTIVDEVKSVLDAINMPYKIDVVDFTRVDQNMKKSIERDRIIWKS